MHGVSGTDAADAPEARSGPDRSDAPAGKGVGGKSAFSPATDEDVCGALTREPKTRNKQTPHKSWGRGKEGSDELEAVRKPVARTALPRS